MRFKRQEAFRYEFGQPIPCSFRIVRIGEKEVESDKGKAEIYDISPKGMKIGTSLNIPLEKKVIILEVSFTLNKTELIFHGRLVWQRRFANDYFYGVNLILSLSEETKLINELKQYVALHYKNK
jgi:hypothetical protein